MTATNISSIRGFCVLIVLLLLPAVFIAQNKVVIKERVELGQQRALSAGGDELEFVVRWTVINSAQHPERFSDKPVELFVVDANGNWGGYKPWTDERSANYTVTVDSSGDGYSTVYSGVSQFTTTSVCSPVFGIDVYVDTNVIWNVGHLMFVVEVYHSWELDTCYSFLEFYDSYGYVSETTYRGFFTDYHPDITCESDPRTAHYVITDIGDIIQHGELNYISIAAVDNEGVRITPPETRVQLSESSAPWGYLEDYNNGKQGKVLDSLTLGSYNERELFFYGWEKEPDAPRELTLMISSYDASLPPVQATFTLLPPEVGAIPGRSEIPYGDTTLLMIQARHQGAPWMDKPPDWKVQYWIAQADTFGFLYNADSTKTGTYFDDYSSRMYYSSNPETEPDSVEVLIAMYIHEPCYDCGGEGGASKISWRDSLKQKNGPQRIQALMREQRKKQNINSRLSKVTGNRIQQSQILSKIRGQNSSLPTSAATSSRINYDEHFGLARIVLKKQGCILVVAEHPEVVVGDTILLSFVYGETGKPVPLDKKLDVEVNGGVDGESGTLLVKDKSGTSFHGVKQPISYIAPAVIPEDERDVLIVAVESETGEGPLAKIVQGNMTNQSAVVSLSESDLINPHIIAALKAWGNGSSCPVPIRSAKVVVPTSIELIVTSDEITGSKSTVLNVRIFTGKKIYVDPSKSNLLVNINAGDGGEGYAHFVYNGIASTSLKAVPYVDIVTGKVQYKADDNEYLGKFPLRIDLSATTKGKNGDLPTSIQIVTLKGSNTVGEYFDQSKDPWAVYKYDHCADTTIQTLGCAMIDMAMILNALGYPCDPGTLNNWMREPNNNGYNGKDVQWNNTIEGFSNGAFTISKPIGDGLKNKSGFYFPGYVPPTDYLDWNLKAGYPAVAQIWNTNSTRSHWVVVTGKTKSGNYTILDPGKGSHVILKPYETICQYRLIAP